MNSHYDEQYYIAILDRYIACGECPVPEDEGSEPLFTYVLSLMENPTIKVMVLSDEVSARIFYDSTLLFIRACFERERFNMQRNQSEISEMKQAYEWSPSRKENGWQALLQRVEQKYKEGFNSAFYKEQFRYGQYEDQMLWERMLKDWKDSMDRKTEQESWENLSAHKKRLDNKLQTTLQNVPQYLKQHQIDKKEFFQAWGLMGGMWNSIDFERIRKIVSIQREYPIIEEVANMMGRIADDEGNEQVNVSTGTRYKLEHASGSDIEGITIGNDLNALLPIELVHCIDNELEEIFIHKYLTNQLQTFRYKSEIMNPSRSLQVKPAKPNGPMIVCLDTSGSMAGKPEKIAHSLIIRLLEIAERQKRDFYLITFSVHIHSMDVKHERAKLLEMLGRTSSGSTDATLMLKATIDMLEKQVRYMYADVLWITDFRIPSTSHLLLEKMKHFRENGTRFYGLQIGMANHNWSDYFNHIYQISYTPSMLY